MSGPRYYENPTVSPLFKLLDDVKKGHILLPRFQRPFVWDEEQRVDLLDSVRRGMPIGSLLVWRTEKHALTCHTNLRGWEVAKRRRLAPWTYLIDGHQRMMTLLSSLTPPDPGLYNEEDPGDRLRWPIYYDLTGEAFVFPPRRGGSVPETWMPVHLLLSGEETYKFCEPLYAAGHNVEARRAASLHSRFADYWIPVIPLVTDDFTTVTVGFQRINKGSTPLKELHMLHAVIAAKGIDLLRELEKAYNKHLKGLGEGWEGIDEDDVLACAKLALGLGIYERDPEKVADKLGARIDAIDVAAERMGKAAMFLDEMCGVRRIGYLPYRYQMVLVTLAFSAGTGRPSSTQVAQIVRWFWRSSFLELFTGISEGRLNQTTNEFRTMLEVGTAYLWPRWLSGEVEGPPSPRRDSARLRTLRALLLLRDRDCDTAQIFDGWKEHPDDPPDIIIDTEREMVKGVGLGYTLIARKSRRAKAAKSTPKVDELRVVKLQGPRGVAPGFRRDARPK